MNLLQQIQARRLSRVDIEGSPYFDLYLAAINAGVTNNYDIAENTSLAGAVKYLPLDYIQVINNDAVPIELQIKGQKHYIPAGVIKTVSDEAIWSFSIKNLDGSTATTANKIHCVLQRQPITEDKRIRRSI